MVEKMTGGCQCGEVRYEITGPPGRVHACHCTICQRQSGSAFGLTLWVAAENFRIIHGEPAATEWKSEAERDKLGAFCPDCGVRLYHRNQLTPETLSVKPGTLDDTSKLIADLHIWTQHKQPWITIPDGVEVYEIQPD